MKYAIKNKIKIEAEKSGELAKCPVCKSDVKAYCGSFVVWHWKHISKQDCDSWWETETEWHRNWKDNFPREWQEIVCFDHNTGEKHVADIKTTKGTTIEFQNSPISIDELKQREFYYDDLIWVVNAEKFKDNFELKSMVNRKLQSIEIEYNARIETAEQIFNDEIEEKKEFIRKKEYHLESLASESRDLKNSIDEFQNFKLNHTDISSKIINNILGVAHYPSWRFRRFSSFATEIERNKNELIEIVNLKKSLKEKLGNISARIQTIKSLDNNDTKLHKIIPHYKILEITNYSNVLYVDKSLYESSLLFKPGLEKVASEYQLETMLRNGSSFIFYYDFQDDLTFFEHEMDIIENNIKKVRTQFDKMLNDIAIEFNGWLTNKISGYKDELIVIKKKILSNQKEIDIKQEELNSLIINSQSNKNLKFNKLNNLREEKTVKAMKENKGQYAFSWKYPRKVWLEASCKVFFDIGEDSLFYRVNSSLFKKISKKDFISKLY